MNKSFAIGCVVGSLIVAGFHVVAAQQPTSPDFQASYDAIIKQLSTDYAVSQAQVFADQRELARLAAVEKERDELKAKLAESHAVRGSTNPEPPK